MAGPTLRQGLDRDVYAVLKKLEGADEGSFNTIGKVYDAIQSSNSHLRRQKKKPLEDSIYRVLEFRKEELRDSDDSDAAIEEAEARMLPKKTEDERFLLNRQMTKHWHTERKEPSTIPLDSGGRQPKKRRIEGDGEGRSDHDGPPDTTASSNELPPDSATTNGNGAPNAHTTIEKTETTTNNISATIEKVSKKKKTAKSNGHEVSRPTISEVRLGGIKETYERLFDLMSISLVPQDPGWNRDQGILLSGPMGVGKRSLVRSVAAKLQVPIVSMADCLQDSERMEKSVMEAMDEAMRLAPCIIFIENAHDCMGASKDTAHHTDHLKVIRYFEKERQKMLDQLPPHIGVLVVGTTTNLANVHIETLYSGCFNNIINVDVPGLAAREDIFRVLTEGMNISTDIDFAELAKMTHGYVGMDIKALIGRAQVAPRIWAVQQRRAAKGDGDNQDMERPGTDKNCILTFEHIQEAMKDYVPLLRNEGFTEIPKVSWKQVGGLAEVRKQLNTSIIGPIKTPDIYAGWGLNRPSGVILWGPPGCGKTLVAQAVANDAQASFILISGPELLNKYVGESERGVRELFQRARSSAPCILFFDEMDSLVPRRTGTSSDAGVRVVNALLAELDGVRDRSGVYVIGTTNRPDMIDPAMMRPGRLSVRLFLDLPTEDERVDILKTLFLNSRPNSSSDEISRLERVARDPRCKDFSGADLDGLRIKAIQIGLNRWMEGKKTVAEVDDHDWDDALATTYCSVDDPASYRELEAEMRNEKGKGRRQSKK